MWRFDDCQSTLFTYNALFSKLASEGYTTQSFPYDWRRDVRDSADDLYEKIVSLRVSGPRVAIVAHSLGGLVVAAMLVKHPELYTSGDLADIVLLGTPLKGLAIAYATVEGFKSPLDQLVSPAVASRLSSNWPSMYELMPRWTVPPLLTDARLGGQSYPPNEVFLGNVAADLTNLFPPLTTQGVTDGATLWKNILNLPSYPKGHAIVGVGQATLTGMKVPALEPAGLIALPKPCVEGVVGNGDNTVPYDSSIDVEALWIPADEFRYIAEKHVSLPSNQTVIQGILAVLGGAHLPLNSVLTASPSTTFPAQQSFQKCSPIDLTVTDGAGDTISKSMRTIPDAQSFVVGDTAQYFVPSADQYNVAVQGTGTGVFNIFVRQTDTAGNETVIGSFNDVPVTSISSGTFSLNSGALSNLQYNFAGKAVIDTIPANVTPPTILCTGCYFIIQNLRATFAFSVGYQGGVSTFAYNYRSSSQAIQFVSTATSQIAVSGTTATFSGQGTLNGKSGYSFAVTTTDGGAAGSGLDTCSITITGPGNYSYIVNATVVGGDVVVHP